MSFIDAIKTGFSKYTTFSGEASRSEFWYFTLFFAQLLLVSALINVGLFLIALIICLPPYCAVSTRRFNSLENNKIKEYAQKIKAFYDAPISSLSFGAVIIYCFIRFFNVWSRASDREFWNFYCLKLSFEIYLIVLGIIFIVFEIEGWGTIVDFVIGASALTYIPIVTVGASLTIRRLHDISISGWRYLFYVALIFLWFFVITETTLVIDARNTYYDDELLSYDFLIFCLLFFAPYRLLLLFFFLRPGTKGKNRFGENPLERK